MLKIYLAGLCAAMCGRSISTGDILLAVYWAMVAAYWMINFWEGIE